MFGTSIAQCDCDRINPHKTRSSRYGLAPAAHLLSMSPNAPAGVARRGTPIIGRARTAREVPSIKAALLTAYGEPLEIRDVPTPRPGPGQVLVRVAGVGVCHSDLTVVSGRSRITFGLPLILGHEVSGYVAALGKGVTGIEEGDPVAVFGAWGCGQCRYCVRGDEQACDQLRWVGHGPPGGYAEYLMVPAARHLELIGKLDPVEAAALTDAGLTPYRAVRRALPRLVPGSVAVAIGIGGLGHFGLQYLRILSAARVVAVDTSPLARRLATRLGADLVLDPADDVAGMVRDLTGGDGADVVLDFVGSSATMELSVRVVGRFALIVNVGLGGGVLSYSPYGYPAEVDLTTAWWGSRNDLHEVVSLARAGRLTPSLERHPLGEVDEVLARLEAGKVEGRAVLIP